MGEAEQRSSLGEHVEWIGGVTSGFDWWIPEGSRTGNQALAIPTTVNTYDSTLNYFMDDFIMATSLQDLESSTSGSSGDTTLPAPPQNPRLAQ